MRAARPVMLDLFCGAGVEELSQAIPPAYTEHLGRQLIAVLGA